MVVPIVLAVLAVLLFLVALRVDPHRSAVPAWSRRATRRFKHAVDPGLHVMLPFIDRIILVDMREQVVDVPPQEVITSDNVVVSVDAVIYYEATDPQRLVYNIANFQLAVTKLAQTNLRNVIGDMELDAAADLTRDDQHEAPRDPRRRYRQVGARAWSASRSSASILRPTSCSRCTTR